MERTTLGVLLVSVALLVSCNTTFRHAQDSYAPYDFSRPVQVYPRLSAEACEHRLLGIWTVSGEATIGNALARLTRGSAKIDNIMAYQVGEKWGFWFLGVTSCTVVSGYPVLYKDTAPKLELFEANKLAGRLVKKPEVAMPSKTPAPYVPTTTGGTGSTYTPKKVAPAPLAPRKAAGPTKRGCEKSCGKFAGLWKGSDAIRSTIRMQCVKKCMQPENSAYRKCIDGAAKIDDIARCNSM